jgi:spore coat protein A
VSEGSSPFSRFLPLNRRPFLAIPRGARGQAKASHSPQPAAILGLRGLGAKVSVYSRRTFLERALVTGSALALPVVAPEWAVGSATHRRLAKYVERLPVPGDGIVVARPVAPGRYAFSLRQISRRLHPQLPPTPLWAYDDGSGLGGQVGSFGIAIAAEAGTPLRVSYTNRLPRCYPSWLPVDTRITPLGREVRIMTHLHGAFVAAASDGNPAITPLGFGRGETQHVHYTNEAPQMSASMLWFHDHGLGATRLNVVAGLAGGYILRDEFDTGTVGNANGLPAGRFEIPLVVQDRLFNADGSFRYPTSDVPGATWIGEYFGDVMLVNGKVWPHLDVEPRLYRLRFLNGCNARILTLRLPGTRMWQIGAEGGMWDRPVRAGRLVLAPAERADVLVDFSSLSGETIVVSNHRPPSPVTTPAPPLAPVMQIRVAGRGVHRPRIPELLKGGRAARLPRPPRHRRRFITLSEVRVDTDGWELTLNGVGFDDAPSTERPRVGTVEDWYFINLTPDTHPMHVHLFTFQVVGRVPFDVDRYIAAAGRIADGVPGGTSPWPYATGPLIPADPTERGYKDTVKANPGTFTIIRGRFDLPHGVSAPQTYVYHCHILEHEDNDMMRPFIVEP